MVDEDMMNEPFWYDLDVFVADGTGVINLSLSDGASTRLIGQDTHDVITYQGLRVKTLPTFIEDEILGKCALFEVIFRSKSTAVRLFNVSRLSEDEEVLEQYELKYLPKEKEEVEAGGRCKGNWELTAAWTGAKVKVPVKFIVGELDMVYTTPGVKEYVHGGAFKNDVPLLEDCIVIENAGHFINQERPHQINAYIHDFIAKF
ncbi:hypothetical protein CASFOL_012918 [Castilleja foliolosa]|uniref:Uncharacterized protein n=1 Tax=Castilleja foliolosa TaxID=1961234 RepID=A0ABD3DIG5_9LAMI